jgi:cytoskeletal protein CcmA (bactofilin family)
VWKWLTRRLAGDKGIQVVLDRRKGERRVRDEAVDEERRRGDRRRPIGEDLGEVRSFLGEDTHLTGELSFAGTLRVDGRFEGPSIRGEVLIVGETGRVEADIRVEVLQVGGQVRGESRAARWADFLESSHVTGTIRTPRLTIWKGATFNGTCEMPAAVGPQAPTRTAEPPTAPHA